MGQLFRRTCFHYMEKILLNFEQKFYSNRRSSRCCRSSTIHGRERKLEIVVRFSTNSRFDGSIHPMADLEMFFPMIFLWFLFRGHSRTNLAWLPLWQPWAIFFIGEIPRWPPNDVLHICNIYLFHKTWSVIHVIRGFRGQGIHFWWYYVHLILF